MPNFCAKSGRLIGDCGWFSRSYVVLEAADCEIHALVVGRGTCRWHDDVLTVFLFHCNRCSIQSLSLPFAYELNVMPCVPTGTHDARWKYLFFSPLFFISKFIRRRYMGQSSVKKHVSHTRKTRPRRRAPRLWSSDIRASRAYLICAPSVRFVWKIK